MNNEGSFRRGENSCLQAALALSLGIYPLAN